MENKVIYIAGLGLIGGSLAWESDVTTLIINSWL